MILNLFKPIKSLNDKDLISSYKKRGDVRYVAELFQRYSQCGNGMCERLFTTSLFDGSALGLITPLQNYSSGLPLEDAQAVCEKLYSRGFCINQKREQRSNLLQRPEWTQMKEKINDRIASMVPPRGARDGILLPNALIDAGESSNEIERLKTSNPECFNSLFELDASGNLKIKKTIPSLGGIAQKISQSYPDVAKIRRPNGMNGFQEEFSKYLTTYSEAFNSIATTNQREWRDVVPSCSETIREMGMVISRTKSNFQQNIRRVPSWGNSLSEGIVDILEEDVANSGRPNDSRLVDLVQKILGEELFAGTMDFMQTFHPDSPQFDCNILNNAPPTLPTVFLELEQLPRNELIQSTDQCE